MVFPEHVLVLIKILERKGILAKDEYNTCYQKETKEMNNEIKK